MMATSASAACARSASEVKRPNVNRTAVWATSPVVAHRGEHVRRLVAAGRAGRAAGADDAAALQVEQDRLAAPAGEHERGAAGQPLRPMAGQHRPGDLGLDPGDEGVPPGDRVVGRAGRQAAAPPPSPRRRRRSRCPSGARTPARRRGSAARPACAAARTARRRPWVRRACGRRCSAPGRRAARRRGRASRPPARRRCGTGCPRAPASAASSAIGCTVPTSLFASWMLTSVVSSRSAAARSSGETRPSWSTPSVVTSNPVRPRNAADSSTAGCSIALTTTCRPRGSASAMPLTAALSDSVPPEVKVISPGRAPSTAATSARA